MYFFRTFDPDQGGPDLKTDIFCQVGAILVKLCAPSWIYTLEPTWIRPTQTHALMGSIVTLVFRVGQILSNHGWGPATIFPLLREDHVNNHFSLGVPPPEHGYVDPVSSRGHPSQIRRYRALHPGQLSARSSRGLVLTPDQLSVGSSRGHPLKIRRYRALHHGLSTMSSQGHPPQSRRYRALRPGQRSARSSWGHVLAPDQHSVRPSQGHILGFVSCSSFCFP